MTLVLAVALAGALLLAEQSFVALRVTVAITVDASLLLLNRQTLGLSTLRLFELAIFGALVAQVSAMLWSTLNQFAEAKDFVTAIGGENVYLAEFCVMILV